MDDEQAIDIGSDPVLFAAYRDAMLHARGIIDAARHSMINGYWSERKIPLERSAMIAAIAERMRIGTQVGYRNDVPISVVEAAVDALLGRE